MHRLALTFLLILIAGRPVHGLPGGPSVSAGEAYALLRERGELKEVTVSEPFDLSRAVDRRSTTASGLPAFNFNRVVFGAGMVASDKVVGAHLRFHDSDIHTLEAAETRWLGELVFEGGRIETSADFRDNEFQNAVRFHFTQFGDETWFTGSSFAESTEFHNCSWRQGARFSGATFSGPVSFNDSLAEERVVFQATVFETDVSFIGFEVRASGPGGRARVDFLNTLFKGDAEFRYCRFDAANFSSRKQMSVFYGLADFRGCEMGTASFEYVETRGVASFVKARFGEGGASFANASLAGPLTNLDSVASAGPVNLSDTYMPTLRFRWSDLGSAILDSEPSVGVLEELAARLTKLERNRENLAIQYDLARLGRKEVWRDPSKGLPERAAAGLEWVTWGWSTGYGTKLGRIVLISSLLWLVLSLPPMARPGILVRGPVRARRKESNEDRAETVPRYSPIYWHELPPGCSSYLSRWRRLGLALAYTFGLMFKIGFKHVTYVEIEPQGGRHRFERYFMFLWFLGSVLVALMALTLANASPVISKVIGDVLL